MLLPYRVKISETKVTHFTPILALCTCLCRSHYRNQYRLNKQNTAEVRGSKFMFKMSTIHANTCIQTTTPLRNRWWVRRQCPVLVLRSSTSWTGVKVNGDYYRNTVLLNMLLPDIRSIFGDYYVFQQDGAPAHRPRDTVTMLQRETPEFSPPEMWPPNSPDLNPVDYSIWVMLQERVYRSRIHDV